MTQEEALNIITSAKAPEFLTSLQINVFQGAWNNHRFQSALGSQCARRVS